MVGELEVIGIFAFSFMMISFMPVGLMTATVASFLSFLFWLAMSWIWIITAETNAVPLATLFLAPALICLALSIMGYTKQASLDYRDPY